MMKADVTEQVDTFDASPVSEAGASSPIVADPFAVDLFAVGRASVEAEQQIQDGTPEDSEAIAPEERSWNSSLPRVTTNQVRVSETIAAMPRPLAPRAIETLSHVVARFTHVEREQLIVALLNAREASLGEVARRPTMMPRLFVTIAVEPDDARLAVEINGDFAIGIVDRTLGGDGSASLELSRTLSVAEAAVVEFLFINVVRELNEALDQPLLRFAGLEAQAPSWLMTVAGEAKPSTGERGIIVAVRLECAATTGVARLYFAPETLRALDASHNPLLRREASDERQEQIDRFNRIARDVPLHLMIGETDIAAGDLAELEIGDCIVIERRRVFMRDKSFEGELRFRVGDGENIQLTGRAAELFPPEREMSEEAIDDLATNAAINFEVEDFLAGEITYTTERLKMQDEQTTDGENDSPDDSETTAATALDGVLLTVHVEMAARRLSLDELARLRPGQIINLDCRATDPVDLVHEGRRLARGELVDIEGTLGVRITQLAG